MSALAKCPKYAVCAFFRKRAKYPISDDDHAHTSSALCNGDHHKCALFQVMDKIGFLKVPPDLRPQDVGRVFTILAKT